MKRLGPLLVVASLLFSTRARAQATSDAPLLPEQPANPPISTSGTDAQPPEAPAAPVDPRIERRQDARIRTLEERISRDETRIRRLEDRVRILKNLKLEAYVQPQLLVQTYNSAASPNRQPDGTLPPGIGANDVVAKPDGTTTNGTFFRVRRARMRTTYETDVMRLFLQIDGLPAGGIGPGIGTILRNAEATGIARWTNNLRTEFTAGLFFTPFRKELLERSDHRSFIERTWFIMNAFPIERDYGAHAKTILQDRLVIDLAVVNGQRLGEKTFVALPDLNHSKDLIAYATYQIGFATLGVSGYTGRGQIVDTQALRFKTFARRALNAQAEVKYPFVRQLGESRLSAELTFAQNMDTGVIYPFAVPRIKPAFPDAVEDLQERAFYVRFEQEIVRHFLAAYRYDMYTPNTDIKNNARDTHAFLAMWKISPNLQLKNELGWAIDNVHALNTPAPSKHIVYFSSVLQAMF
jgi:hypothetical protein